jgi:hypothetical protein
MDPRLFLALAQDLIHRCGTGDGLVCSGGAAECRSSISRAYYALHLAGLEFLRKIGIEVTTGGDCHTAVEWGLVESGETALKGIGSHIGDFHRRRNRADYHMDDRDAEDVEQAQEWVALSGDLITQLDAFRRTNCSDAQGKSAVSNRILGWAQRVGKGSWLWRA